MVGLAERVALLQVFWQNRISTALAMLHHLVHHHLPLKVARHESLGTGPDPPVVLAEVVARWSSQAALAAGCWACLSHHSDCHAPPLHHPWPHCLPPLQVAGRAWMNTAPDPVVGLAEAMAMLEDFEVCPQLLPRSDVRLAFAAAVACTPGTCALHLASFRPASAACSMHLWRMCRQKGLTNSQ